MRKLGLAYFRQNLIFQLPRWNLNYFKRSILITSSLIIISSWCFDFISKLGMARKNSDLQSRSEWSFGRTYSCCYVKKNENRVYSEDVILKCTWVQHPENIINTFLCSVEMPIRNLFRYDWVVSNSNEDPGLMPHSSYSFKSESSLKWQVVIRIFISWE